MTSGDPQRLGSKRIRWRSDVFFGTWRSDFFVLFFPQKLRNFVLILRLRQFYKTPRPCTTLSLEGRKGGIFLHVLVYTVYSQNLYTPLQPFLSELTE